MLDAASGRPSVTNGSNGFRFGQSGLGKWNLGLGDTDPALTLHGGTPTPSRST